MLFSVILSGKLKPVKEFSERRLIQYSRRLALFTCQKALPTFSEDVRRWQEYKD